MENVLVQNLNNVREDEIIYPYTEEYRNGEINFKYWVVDECSRFLYDPKDLVNSKILEGYKYLINKGDNILNVGSGYGITNCIIRNLIGDKGAIVGVDPIPSNYLVSNSHFGLNNYSNCFFKNVAASYSNDKCIVWNIPNSSVSYDHTDVPGETIAVNSIRCDELITEFGNFDTLILDVNGYEWLVLNGCFKILTTNVNLVINLDYTLLSYNNSTYENIFDIIKVDQYKGLMLLKNSNILEEFDPDKLLLNKESAVIFIKPKDFNNTNEKNKKVGLIKNFEDILTNVAEEGITPEAIHKTGKNFDETDRLWLRYFLNKPFAKKRRKGNIVMFHLGRCGSSVLGSLLDQHPQIHWDSEIFHYIYNNEMEEKKMTTDPMNLLKIRMSWPHKDYYGFETKFTEEEHLRKELANMNILNYLSALSDLDYDKFILLKRKNYLKQIISLIAAKQTKTFHTTTEMKEANKVKIDPKKVWFGNKTFTLVELFEYFDKEYKVLENLISQKNSLSLTYEDDILENPLVAFNKVCNFLGIHSNDPSIIHKRTNPFAVNKLIENIEKITKVIKPTKYAWMLND
ncbi:MAG: FkbM family methyltransferase [Ignavibacteria bacterium]|nr:FkbM family methyltransferase [Ignavibacteria bacterium]